VLLTPKGRLALVALVSLLAAVVLARQEQARPVAPKARRPELNTPKSSRRPSAQADALRDGRRIDPNRATAEELELLPGVGPSLARRLVESREAQGPFRSPQALRRVKGVGAKTLAKFERFLSFDSEQIEDATQPELHVGGAHELTGRNEQAATHVEPQGPETRPEIVEPDDQVHPGAESHIGSVVVQP
jgi:competence protein ComEA